MAIPPRRQPVNHIIRKSITVQRVINKPVINKVPNKETNQGCPPGFMKCMPRLLEESNESINLYAIIGTWHESDIIEACVNNCFINGCKKVFIVDNDSPDDTCKKALKAGAHISRVYKTKFYEEETRLRLMNDVVKEVTEYEKLPCLWWLFLDADEFPCTIDGEKIINLLNKLNKNINCVGGNAIDLYPTKEPYYKENMHPADFMSEGLRRIGGRGVFCDRSHWKHVLLKYTNGMFTAAQSRGNHIPFVKDNSVSIIEPKEEIVLFHAPFREKEQTFKRLEALCGKDSTGQYRSILDDKTIGAQGAIKRFKCLEHIYKQEYDKVIYPHSQAYGREIVGIALYEVARLLPKLKSIPRWYTNTNKVELPLLV